MEPVTHDPKMPGPIKVLQALEPRSPILEAISRRSFGMLCAPPITLNQPDATSTRPHDHQEHAAPVEADA